MTRFSFLRCVVLMVVSLSLVAGCDKPTRSPRAKRPKKVTTKNLPKLGDHFGPLDDGRLEVAPPAGWHVPPRSSKYIARFQKSEEGSYPSIIITAEDHQSGFSVSKKNVDKFVKQTAAKLKKDKKTARLADSVLPVEVGSFVGVIYKRRGRAPFGFKKIIVDRLIIETVVDGRKYAVELRAREGDAARYQPHLLAVASEMKFIEPGGGKTLDEAPEEATQEMVEEKPEKKEQPEEEPQKKQPEKKEPEKDG